MDKIVNQRLRLPILGVYQNGNYKVVILKDGTKIRSTEDNEFIPAFSENCDVKITDKCGMNCPYCYEGCTREGRHGELLNWKWLDSLHPYTELALNGNDMDHPQMEQFLRILKEKKVIPNITVHILQFLTNLPTIRRFQEEGLIYGIGISLSNIGMVNMGAAIEGTKHLKNCVFHTIVGITTAEQYEMLADNRCKVLVLGYKERGRGIDYETDNLSNIKDNKDWLYEHLEDLTRRCKVLSFDNLALDQLDVRRLLTDEEWEEFYMGDDGGYTFYMDLVAGTFSKNSLCEERFPIGEKTIEEMFQFIRTKYNK